MKTIELMADDAVFGKILDFLKLLPSDKIRLRVSDTHIPDGQGQVVLPVDDTEQWEIENILKKEECHQAVRSKAVVL